MQNLQKKGFTLIELLVVIAIIGILAAAVVVSLGGATDSAKDARDTATLAGIRPLTILHTSANGDVATGICPTTPIAVSGTLKSIHEAITKVVAGREDKVKVHGWDCVETTDSDWALWIRLEADTNKAFCIDADSTHPTLDWSDTAGDLKPDISTGECPIPTTGP